MRRPRLDNEASSDSVDERMRLRSGRRQLLATAAIVAATGLGVHLADADPGTPSKRALPQAAADAEAYCVVVASLRIDGGPPWTSRGSYWISSLPR